MNVLWTTVLQCYDNLFAYYGVDLVAMCLTVTVMKLTADGSAGSMRLAFILNLIASVLWLAAAIMAMMIGGILLNVIGFGFSIRGIRNWQKKVVVQS